MKVTYDKKKKEIVFPHLHTRAPVTFSPVGDPWWTADVTFSYYGEELQFVASGLSPNHAAEELVASIATYEAAW